MHTYNYGLKHYMFVLNLACLFFLKTSGSLSSAVMLSSCCIKHRIGGVEHVVLKANTTEVDIFTGSMLAQMHTKMDWICLWKSAQSSIIRKHYCSKINYFNKIKTSTIATICLELLCIGTIYFLLKTRFPFLGHDLISPLSYCLCSQFLSLPITSLIKYSRHNTQLLTHSPTPSPITPTTTFCLRGFCSCHEPNEGSEKHAVQPALNSFQIAGGRRRKRRMRGKGDLFSLQCWKAPLRSQRSSPSCH